eukprot:6049684-Alexandrium_andersonii.AAC.1
MCRRPVAAEEWRRLDAWEAAREAEAPTILVIGAGSAAGGFLQAAGRGWLGCESGCRPRRGGCGGQL